MRIKSTVFGILFSIFFLSSSAADKPLLNEADSLFKSQKYTQAFAMYQTILDQGDVSQAMLLKMAFIQDASGNYADALYYLDRYYLASADRLAVGKIEEIATEHELKGYQYNDTHYFLALFKRYKLQALLVPIAFSMLLLVYVLRKSQKGEKPYAAAVLQVLTVSLLLLTINFKATPNGIITSDATLLRSGPSAGAEPVDVLLKGHKVIVLDRETVWTKILWNGEQVFVRNNRLKLI